MHWVAKIAGRCALAALAPLIGGCIIWPNYCVEQFGVSSRVMDCDSGVPIKGATIQDERNPKRHCTSNEKGEFKLRPKYHWHGGYWFAGIGLKILPLTHDVIMPYVEISVSAPGFETARFCNGLMGSTRPGPVPWQNGTAEFDETFFIVPKLELKKSSPATTQHAVTSEPAS